MTPAVAAVSLVSTVVFVAWMFVGLCRRLSCPTAKHVEDDVMPMQAYGADDSGRCERCRLLCDDAMHDPDTKKTLCNICWGNEQTSGGVRKVGQLLNRTRTGERRMKFTGNAEEIMAALCSLTGAESAHDYRHDGSHYIFRDGAGERHRVAGTAVASWMADEAGSAE